MQISANWQTRQRKRAENLGDALKLAKKLINSRLFKLSPCADYFENFQATRLTKQSWAGPRQHLRLDMVGVNLLLPFFCTVTWQALVIR